MRTIEEIQVDLDRVNDVINEAYWCFTRTKRGRPPGLVVPHAYAERKKLEEELRAARRELRATST